MNRINQIILSMLLIDFSIQEQETNSLTHSDLQDVQFGQENNTEVRGQKDSTIALHCIVNNKMGNTITWIQHINEHVNLLTVAQYVFINDQRFHIRHDPNTDNWQLIIQELKIADTGTYECQISSYPVMSIFTSLVVVEAFAIIKGSTTVEEGETLELVCEIQNLVMEPSYIFWYHDDAMINYNNNVQIKIKDGKSILILNKTTPHDSGKYKCEPSYSRHATVTVRILSKQMRQLQEKNSSSEASFVAFTIVFTAILFNNLHTYLNLLHIPKYAIYII